MRSPNIESGQLVKVDSGWVSGMNTVRHPWLLNEQQYRRGVNIVNRGGIVQTRPGFAMRLILPAGNLQGMIYFRVTKNNTNIDNLVFAVDGKVYATPFPLAQPRNWDSLQLKGIQFDSNVPMIHFCDCEKTVQFLSDETVQIVPTFNVLVMQDGKSPAAFWDGEISQHIAETAPTLGTPRGTWMTFSGGRLWVARDKLVIASDFLDPLSFRERTEGEGRGDFSFKKSITGITTFMGNDRTEAVVVFTEDRCELLQSGIRDRAQWSQTSNFQSILFPSTGCVAGRSIAFQAGLMWWYAAGGLVSSDAVASSQLTSQVNFKDAEMAFSKQFMFDDQSGICGLSFENYLLISAPIGQNFNSETFVLDYSPLSEASSEKIAAWSSVWTGIRPIQWTSANIGNKRRAFAASIDYTKLSDGSHNHIWEIFMPEREDSFFELDEDFTITEYRQPIYCEFETRLIGDGQDLKVMRYSELDLIEVGGDVSINIDYRGRRGSYKEILCKKIIAPVLIETSGVDLTNQQIDDLGILRKQYRRLTTEDASPNAGCPTCENEYSENIDKAFSLLIRWCGQLAVESIRMFTDAMPEKSTGKCEPDETKACLVSEDGQNFSFERDPDFVPVDQLYQETSSQFWTATKSFTELLTCAGTSVTGPISVTAFGTYRSRISQADADTRALDAATQAAQNQAAYLRTQFPCFYDSVQYFTKNCFSELNSTVRTMIRQSSGQMILGGSFWLDKTTQQGKITARDSVGLRVLDWVEQNGFLATPVSEPSSIVVNSLLQQADGKIVVLGNFAQYTNQARNDIARLEANGDLDVLTTFGSGFNNTVATGCLMPSALSEVTNVKLVTVTGAGGKYFDLSDQNGRVRVWNAMAAVSEVSTVQIVSISSIDGDYFDVYDASGPVRVWADKNGTSPPPATPSGGRLLEVDYLSSDNLLQILNKFQSHIDADASFTCTANGVDTLTITAIPAGARANIAPSPGSTHFVTAVTTQGQNAASAPSAPSGGRLLPVTTLLSDTLAQVLDKFQIAIEADSQFSATDNNVDTLTITDAVAGPRAVASEPDAASFYITTRRVLGQNAGSIVAGGVFTSYNGTSVSVPIVRVLTDGTYDPTLAVSTFTEIFQVIPASSGKIFVAGYDSVAGKVLVARLNADGSTDLAFTTYEVTVANPGFASMASQADGKIIVSFTGANSNKNLVRLGTNGAVDSAYDVGVGLDAAARAIVLDSTGKVYIGGGFTSYRGTLVNKLIRTTTTGTIDSAFTASAFGGGDVFSLHLNEADAILSVGGSFTSYDSQTSAVCWIRLSLVGAYLPAFTSFTAGASYRSTISQADADAQALALATVAADAALPCA
jgi:uncharacterized delta-60 repeat protein